MKPAHRHEKVWLGLIAVALTTVLLWVPVRKMLELAAVQNAVQRDWEISFGYREVTVGDGEPAYLPAFLDSAARNLFDRTWGYTAGYDGSQPAQTRNRNITYYERFRALFRGPIEDLHIYDFEEFHGDLGVAIGRLRDLRRFTAWAMDGETRPTEGEWAQLCAHLRALPHLEEVEIGGLRFTDRSLAPLAGHPELRKLSIRAGRLTKACIATLATLPKLTELDIDEQASDGDDSLTAEHGAEAALSAALPNVQIVLP